MNNPLISRLMELAATADAKSDNSAAVADVAFGEEHPELVAPIMRYDMLLKQLTDDYIRQHTQTLDRQELIQAKTAYTMDYLLALPIPYAGITRLCDALLDACRRFNVQPVQVWQDFADGSFNWQADIDYMSTL